jgi:hypothetical protein
MALTDGTGTALNAGADFSAALNSVAGNVAPQHLMHCVQGPIIRMVLV